MFKWLWRSGKNKSAAGPAGITQADGFFLRVGNAMAHDIFRTLCAEKVHLARLLTCDYGEAEDRARKGDPPQGFNAVTYHDEMLVKPETLTSVREALRALSPAAMQATPIVFLVADAKYGTRARSWVQSFNAQYLKAGGLPIVRLVICQDAASSAALASCFEPEETDPEMEGRFAKWCAKSNIEPGVWLGR